MHASRYRASHVERSRRSGNDVSAEGAVAERRLNYREVWPTVTWIVSIVPVVFLLGYVIGLPLYVFAYLKARGRGWRLSGALSFGHLSFAAVGAFGAGWLSLRTANKLASFPGLGCFITSTIGWSFVSRS